jgi:hypothetical protein
MTSDAQTPEAYLNAIAEDKKVLVEKLRNSILKNLPNGFQEVMAYGMLGYVVPHNLYPNGYHCNPKQALPFMALAAQKSSVNFYHMAIYADEDLYNWFINEYKKRYSQKLDMGKSCIRFKKIETVPFELIEELVSKISVPNWINTYERLIKR